MACRTCMGSRCPTPEACGLADDSPEMLGRLLIYALALVLLVWGGVWIAS